MRVAIIDYQSGNLHSAHKAFLRAANDHGLKAEITVTADAGDVLNADRIVLPGVGAFGDCHAGLRRTPGMIEALEEAVRRKGRPFFGICVGMQLLATRGLEHGVHDGLNWLEGEVRLIQPGDPSLKIPHMGWNTLNVRHQHKLLEGIPAGPDGWHAYFVHSYHLCAANDSNGGAGHDTVIAETDYGGAVTAFVARDNIAGSQFHPEKSQKLGLRLIANFLQWRP